MSATKNLRTIIAAGTSNTAGSTTTGTAVDLTTKYGGLLTIKITNGATGPTVAARALVLVSGDNTNWKTLASFSGDSTNAAVYEFPIEIPFGTMYVNVQVDSNTAQTVTCEAFLQELTTI